MHILLCLVSETTGFSSFVLKVPFKMSAAEECRSCLSWADKSKVIHVIAFEWSGTSIHPSLRSSPMICPVRQQSLQRVQWVSGSHVSFNDSLPEPFATVLQCTQETTRRKNGRERKKRQKWTAAHAKKRNTRAAHAKQQIWSICHTCTLSTHRGQTAHV